MENEYNHRRRVEFSETDQAGLMHFSNFFRFMESAEHAFVRSLGLSIVMDQTNPPVGWPRVNVSCEYFKPVVFEDIVDIQLLISRISKRSITYVFRFWKGDLSEKTEVARGKMVAVCVTRNKEGKFSPTPIPKEFLGKICEVAKESLEFPAHH